MSTTNTNAYLPSVYKNAYQYSQITTGGLVFKDTSSTFTAFVGTENKQVIQWDGDNSTWKAAAITIDAAFPEIKSGYNGLISNNGTELYNIDGMSNEGVVYAVKYNNSSKFEGVALNEPFVTISNPTDADTTAANYVLSVTKSSSDSDAVYTYSLVKEAVYVTPNGIDNTIGYMLKGKESSSEYEWIKATPANVYNQTISADTLMYATSDSTFTAIPLPDEANNYHLKAEGAAGSMTYTFEANSVPEAITGFNYTAPDADIVLDNSQSTSITATIDGTFTKDVNYIVSGQMDFYIKDITKLVGSDSNDIDFIKTLPVISILAGDDVTIGKMIVKQNQPVQTVNFSKVIAGTGTAAPVIKAKITYGTNPTGDAAGAAFITMIASSMSVSFSPATIYK